MNQLLIEAVRPILSGKKVLLGITGSIAAFKSIDTIRMLREVGVEVRVVTTPSALEFVTLKTLETISGSEVGSDFWEESGTHHIDRARWADVFVIAPASANTIAKLNWGVADNLLLAEALAYRGKFMIAPAMNPEMYRAESTQRNIQELRNKGIAFIGPDVGKTACGEVGQGRKVEPEILIKAIASNLFSKSDEKKALVNLGPTTSDLDPVRFFTNRSSGKMGLAMVWALATRGYDVTVVSGLEIGNTIHQCFPVGTKVINARSTDEMASATLKEFETTDVFVATAAVLDFEFEETKSLKLKKSKDESSLSVFNLKPTVDILSKAGEQKKSNQFILGFAAETDSLIDNATEKLKKKNLDAIFVNQAGGPASVFGSNESSGMLIDTRIQNFARTGKFQLAHQILAGLTLGSMTDVGKSESESNFKSTEAGPASSEF